MNKLIFSILLLLCIQQNSFAEGFRWDIQVTDPSFELKNYKLKEESFKLFLKKTSWRCRVGAEEVNNGIYLRELYCDYSIKKAGTVKTRLSCSSLRKYGEVTLELYDEKKDLTFQLMLKCHQEK